MLNNTLLLFVTWLNPLDLNTSTLKDFESGLQTDNFVKSTQKSPLSCHGDVVLVYLNVFSMVFRCLVIFFPVFCFPVLLTSLILPPHLSRPRPFYLSADPSHLHCMSFISSFLFLWMLTLNWDTACVSGVSPPHSTCSSFPCSFSL